MVSVKNRVSVVLGIAALALCLPPMFLAEGFFVQAYGQAMTHTFHGDWSLVALAALILGPLWFVGFLCALASSHCAFSKLAFWASAAPFGVIAVNLLIVSIVHSTGWITAGLVGSVLTSMFLLAALLRSLLTTFRTRAWAR